MNGARAIRNTLPEASKRIACCFALVSVLVVFEIYCGLVSPGVLEARDVIAYTLLFLLNSYISIVLVNAVFRKELCSPLSLFLFTAMFHFGLSAVLYSDRDFFINTSNRDYYLQSIVFIFSFLVAFHMMSTLMLKGIHEGYARGKTSVAATSWSSPKVLVVIVGLIILGWVGRFIVLRSGIYLQMTTGLYEQGAIPFIGTIRQLEHLPDIAAWIAVSHYMQLRTSGAKSSRFWLFLSVGLVLVGVAYWAPTGKKYDLLQTIIGPLCISYLATKKLPSLKTMLVIAAVAALIFPLSHMYRTVQEEYLTGRAANLTMTEVWDAITGAVDRIGTATEGGAEGKTFGRLNQLEPVAASIRMVSDGSADLRLGQDYLNLLINLVPGFIWPDKPLVNYGNEFGFLSGMIASRDLNTSISVTLAGEAYLNFGYFGVVIGALMAVIYGWFYRMMKFARSEESGRLLYVVTIPVILYIGATFAIYLSGLIFLWLFVYCLCRFMEKRRRDRRVLFKLMLNRPAKMTPA